MTAYVNEAGIWTPIQHIWTNVDGVWTKVQKGFRNVEGTWEQFHAEVAPVNTFTLYALGQSQDLTPTANTGLWKNGTHVFSGALTYNLVVFDANGNVTKTAQYDLYDDAIEDPPVTTNAQQMADDLNALAAGTPVAIFTYLEPDTGRFYGPLESAMTQAGASSIFTGNDVIKFRGAYLLLGVMGQPAILEQYRGADIGSGDPDAALVYSFNVSEGTITDVTEIIGN